MVIARISDRIPGAPEHAATTAHKAETAGWQHVHVTPDIPRGTYNVNADQPSATLSGPGS
jgi:hypothetical protein